MGKIWNWIKAKASSFAAAVNNRRPKMGKIWNWIKAKASSFATAANSQRPKKVSGPISNFELYCGWLPPLTLMVFAIAALVLGRPDWMFLWLALGAIYIRAFIREVQDPDQANVYRFGRFIGRAGAGWYIAIPHLMDLEVIDREVFNVEFDDVQVVTGAGTTVTIKFIATFQIGKTEAAMRKALEISPKDRDLLFHHMTRSKVATAIAAKNDFLEFNKSQTDIEKDVLIRLKEEARKYGYVAKEVEVFITDERVITEAERIKILGRARGEEARSIAEPLKDNWPAAVVATANMIFGGTVKDIKKSAGSKKGVKAVADATSKIGDAIGAVKKAFAGGGGDDDASA